MTVNNKAITNQEDGESKVCSFRETFLLYKRAIAIWWRESPRLFLFVGLHALAKAFQPCASLYLTARLLGELTGERRGEVIMTLVSFILAATVITSLLTAALFRIKETYASVQWNKMPNLYAKKILSMDFSAADDSETYEKFAWVQQSENMGGRGMFQVYVQYGKFLEELFALAGAVALSVSLFTRKVPGGAGWLVILNHPACIVLLIACMVGAALFNSFLEKTVQLHRNRYAETMKFGNRMFFFLYEFMQNRKRDLDIRMYRQEDACIDIVSSCHVFDTKSVYAKSARGMDGILTAMQAVMPGILMGIIYCYVCFKSWAGAFGVGAITQYIGAVTAFSGAVTGILTVAAQAGGNAYYLREVFRFLDIPNRMYQGSLTVEKRADRNYEIEFRNVSFRYPGAASDALSHVSVHFQIGQRLAVVGPNGSGKTTFIKLLCRLYDPTEGEICLNGIDIRKYDYREYLSIFSVVFQDYRLLALPLAQNVAAKERFDRRKVEESLSKAGLAEMAGRLLHGIDTCVGKEFDEEGVRVSGGEGQKIAIARSLYRDAAFMILDEPTAALDPVAEYEVYSGFDRTIGDRTAVYISHRLSSCRFCDEILVFDAGKAVRQGSHEALLAEQDGLYAKLWKAQAQYYAE